MSRNDTTHLIDLQKLDADILAASNPIPVYKKALADSASALEFRFRDGVDVTTLVHERAAVVDSILLHAWRATLEKAAESIVLAAVGGYGRAELHPHSDVDIMLLADEADLQAHAGALEAFLLLLWDIGLEIGHSVRTLEDCVSQGKDDITIATNLMEARLLSGPQALFDEMRRITNQEHIWPGKAFFRAKWEEQKARHNKFHDTAYNLEPNIKEGPGGLRDIQMIGWVAKRHYGVETLQDLVTHGFLTAEEYLTLEQGQIFLWRIRCALHLLCNRREDRLLIDHQRTLAKQFGYQDDEQHKAVEYFMKDYYRIVMELERLNEMLLQLFQEEILLDTESEEPVPINRRFQVRRGFLETRSEKVFEYAPYALLELFLILAQHPELKGVRAETIRQVRLYRDAIDDEFRDDIQCRSLFMELLRQPVGLTHALRRMNRYGVLAAYLPTFGQIVGQMQHDLFHVYTVDEHSLRVVRNLRRFTVPEFRSEFPLCSKVSQTLPKPELLYIAGLFHDIAKGRGGDHAQLGAIDAEAFCQRHDLSDFDTRLVSWLIRSHLLMSSTAQRKDISDPVVINSFAAQVGDINRLNYLYLLTVADIRATSPSVWNAWKDALLAELYHATYRALRRGLSDPIMQGEIIAERQEDARKLLHLHRIPPTDIQALWQRLGEAYFLRYSANEIAWHTKAISEHNQDEPLLLLRQQTQRGGTEIFIYTPLLDGQFSRVTGALDQLGLNIVDARIISSSDGYSLDTYMVLEEDGEPISGKYRLDEIRQILDCVLDSSDNRFCEVRRKISRQLKHFAIPTQVLFEADVANGRTVMEVITSDRPGLLSQIAQAMESCDVGIQNARIATFGERVEDIFFVNDDGKGTPLPADKQEQLRLLLCESLNH